MICYTLVPRSIGSLWPKNPSNTEDAPVVQTSDYPNKIFFSYLTNERMVQWVITQLGAPKLRFDSPQE